MNKTEAKIKKELEKRGFVVLRNGWPDFFVLNENYKKSKGETYAFCCEVKKPGTYLSSEQIIIHSALKSAGLPCYVAYQPEDVIEKRGRQCINRPIKNLLIDTMRELEIRLVRYHKEGESLGDEMVHTKELIDNLTILFEDEQ